MLAALQLAFLALTELAGLLALAALRQGFHLLAQFFDAREGFLQRLVIALAGTFAVFTFLVERLLHALQLVAQTVQALRDAGLGHDGIFAEAAADVVGVALHVARELLLLHLTERFAQLAGGFALRAGETANGVLHLLFEILERVDLFLPAVGEVARLLLVGSVLRIAEGFTQLTFKILLLTGDLVGLLGEVIYLIIRLLAAKTGELPLGLLQSISGALGLGFGLRGAGLLRGRGLAHALQGLLQTLQSLAHLLGILATGTRRHLALLLTLLLTLLSRLPALGLLLALLLPLLTLLTLLALLVLLLTLQLLDLALELFGFTAQHLLLEALLGSLLILPRLIGEFLLATREFLELL